MDVLQPDICWCGGISETLKLCALAHGHSSHATAHLIASQPPTTTPIQEYLIKWNIVHQFFLQDPLHPVAGTITVPDAPGLGLAIDESRVTAQRELNFRDA